MTTDDESDAKKAWIEFPCRPRPERHGSLKRAVKVMIDHEGGSEASVLREDALKIPVFVLLFPSATSHHSNGIRQFRVSQLPPSSGDKRILFNGSVSGLDTT